MLKKNKLDSIQILNGSGLSIVSALLRKNIDQLATLPIAC